MLKASGVAALFIGTLIWAALAHEPVPDVGIDGPPQLDLYHPDEGARPMFGNPGPWNADLVFELGSIDGTEAFGQIVDVAVSADSLIAVADRFGCSVRVFHFPSGDEVSELGGCGDGPGEFRQVVSIAFKADTLLVADFRRARIVRMDPRTGAELGGAPPPVPRTEAAAVMLDASADRILYAPTWLPSGPKELLISQSDDGGEWVGLPDTQISLENRDQTLMRWSEACLLGGEGHVLVANRWALQAIILDRDLTPRFSHRDDRAWVGPREEGERGHWLPGFLTPEVACSGSFGVVRYRVNEITDDRAMRVERGLLLVVSDRGEILQREVVGATAWPHFAALTPVAGLGDVIFSYQNGFGPYPSVQAHRIVLEGGPR
jgi:hypothetical protein